MDAIDRGLHDLLGWVGDLVVMTGRKDLPPDVRERAAAIAWSSLDFLDRLPSDPESACAAQSRTVRNVNEVL